MNFNFKKGDRVKLRQNLPWKPQKPTRLGTVYSDRITAWNGVPVVWDGTKGTKQYCNISNLEPA
jgi:hypothetical protein